MPSTEPRPGGPTFVHLRLHTEYSLVDGIVRVPGLMRAVAAAGMPAVALTDHGNLFAMVKFHREAEKRGVKPVVGADLWIADGGERAEPVASHAACAGLRRIPEPHSTRVAQLPGRPGSRPAHAFTRMAGRRLDEGADRPVGRNAGGCRPRAARGPPCRSGRNPRALAGTLWRQVLPRDPAHRPARRRRAHRGSARTRRRPRRSRSSRRTTCGSWRGRSSRHTKHASAFTAAIASTTRDGRGRTRLSNT